MIGALALLVLGVCMSMLIFLGPNETEDGIVGLMMIGLVVSYATLAVWVALNV